MGFLYYIIFVNTNHQKVNVKEVLITIPVLTIIITVSGILIASLVLSMVITNIIIIIWYCVISYKRIKILSVCIVYALLSIIIALFSAYLINTFISIAYLVVSDDIPLGVDAIMENVTRRVLYNGGVLVIGFFISYFIGRHFHRKTASLDETLKRKLGLHLLIGTILTLGIFFIHTFLRYIITDYALLTLAYGISLATGFGYLLFAVFAFSDNVKFDMEAKHRDELLFNINAYALQMDRMSIGLRQFRHDHLNMLMGFEELVKQGDINGIKDYYNSYINVFNAITLVLPDNIIDSINSIHVPEIKGVLLIKCMQAFKHKIKIVVEIHNSIDMPTSGAAYPLLDINRLVGIFMDNAIEACINVEDAEIRVAVSYKASDLVMVIANTCHTYPPINKISNKNYTTKEGARGLGLFIADQINVKNNMLTFKTEIGDGEFVQTITVYNIQS